MTARAASHVDGDGDGDGDEPLDDHQPENIVFKFDYDGLRYCV
jgi:hypothetical protein